MPSTMALMRSLRPFGALALVACLPGCSGPGPGAAGLQPHGEPLWMREVVRRLRPGGQAPALHCAPDGNGLCTAAFRVSDGVLAVWVLAETDAGPRPLRRQATAIRVFVAHAADEREAHGRLLQALHQPG